MFCTNCGSQLPDEKVKFCPNCGIRIMEAPETEPAAAEAEPAPVENCEPAAEVISEPEAPSPVLPEETAPCAEEACASPEPEEPSAGADFADRQTPPEAQQEPAGKPVYTAPAASAPVSPANPVRKGLHFTATVSIILTALTFLFGSIALLGLLVSMHPGIVIFMSVLMVLLTPLCFGFGVASFIIGLKNKRPAGWIIGLIAAAFAVISFCFGIIYLVAGIFVAAA